MDDPDYAAAFLHDEIDSGDYWRKQADQQVRAFGVILTPQQQARASKGLNRIALSLRQAGFHLNPLPPSLAQHQTSRELDQAFRQYLVTYL